MPGRGRPTRRPPSFDVMMNSVKAITKKTEHIKGFKFELSGVLSNNFLMGHSWYIPYSTKSGAASA
jgi:mitochondrial import receptor subunit TOM40